MSDYTHDFAIVSEGVTDHAVLKNILIGYFKEKGHSPRITPIQPLTDATIEGNPEWTRFGTWENVFRFLREGRHRAALAYSEYIIVQIDTDRSEHTNFGVPHTEFGQRISPEELVVRVRDRLKREIGTDDFEKYVKRFVFAICVHELECWLLPLWTSESKKAAKTKGCLTTVNKALKRNNKTPIREERKKFECYNNVSLPFRQKGKLREVAPLNPSLKLFFDELESRRIEFLEDSD